MKKAYLTINADTGFIIDPVTGIVVSKVFQLPKLDYGSNIILCLTFMDSTLEAFAFNALDNFNLAVKDTYNHLLDPMAFSDAEQFNIAGDWADADPTEGKISVRVNFQSTAFRAAFAYENEPEKMANVELHWLSSVDGSDTIVMQHQLPCRNVAYGGEVLPSDNETYRTIDAQDAIDNAIKSAIRFDETSQRSMGFNTIDTATKTKEFITNINLDGSYQIIPES